MEYSNATCDLLHVYMYKSCSSKEIIKVGWVGRGEGKGGKGGGP